MTLEEKIGQMVQAERAAVTPEEVQKYALGSVLSGEAHSLTEKKVTVPAITGET